MVFFMFLRNMECLYADEYICKNRKSKGDKVHNKIDFKTVTAYGECCVKS